VVKSTEFRELEEIWVFEKNLNVSDPQWKFSGRANRHGTETDDKAKA
jgi:predicted lipid-binding transport protein (Tim44 family)